MELVFIVIAIALWSRFVTRMGEQLDTPCPEDKVYDRRL
jgi:hypothetical protein